MGNKLEFPHLEFINGMGFDHEIVCLCEGGLRSLAHVHVDGQGDEAMKLAQLFAEAPDLLEACERIANVWFDASAAPEDMDAAIEFARRAVEIVRERCEPGRVIGRWK